MIAGRESLAARANGVSSTRCAAAKTRLASVPRVHNRKRTFQWSAAIERLEWFTVGSATPVGNCRQNHPITKANSFKELVLALHIF
jgi:hypothetical protein